MSSLRIGLIGAGTMASSHAQALAVVRGARITRIADPLVERAQELAAVHGAEAVADYRDLLDSVDAVWIATPPYLHREQAEVCAAAGKHLFMEKPLALTLSDCDAIIAAAHRHGVRLMVGQVFRFYPVFMEAYRRFEAGELGDLISSWSKRMAYDPAAQMPAWRTDPRKGGGFTLENQVHELDFVTWFCGEPATVRGVVARTDAAYPGFDSSMSAIISFRNGSIGEVSGSWLSHVGLSQRGIVGTRGGIVIDAWDHLRLKIDGRDEHIVQTPSPGDAVLAEDEHFVACIAGDREPLVGGTIGRRAVELALATLASSDAQRVVSLPLTT
ncbi:MAG: Gfo/Idh/MocA family oxidoreductase [Chloroflexota bacterium]